MHSPPFPADEAARLRQLQALQQPDTTTAPLLDGLAAAAAQAVGADERQVLAPLAQATKHGLSADAERLAQGDRERSFRELAEQIPAIVYRTGLSGETAPRYISPRLQDLGHDPADWVARPSAWWLAVHPQDRERVRREFDEAITHHRTAVLQYRMSDAQGQWHHMHDTARVVQAADGGAPILQGVMLDVSVSVQQQDRLRKLSAAVDQAAESIVITDLQGRIEYVNDAALRSSGYALDELIGSNPRMLKSGSTPSSVYAELWRELVAGRSWQGVLHNRRKNGRTLLESATISPVRDADGTVTHYLAVKQDITENRNLRAELDHYREHLNALVTRRTAALERARADAEAANAAKSAFLAAMSHEIRTPMNGVIGIIELLQRSGLSADQKDLTNTALQSAATLLTLIDDILDFSKIEAGRMALEEAPLDPAHIAESACDALQPVAAARGVQLHVFADPALPAQLSGDAVRLRQIMTNLLGNAIKFSAGLERPGRVALRMGWQREHGLLLQVSDNGIGMSPEVQTRLFQPFEQAERSTTRQYGGTGLGLVICRRLAQTMGGRIVLSSEPGVGSRFEVTLPLPALGDAAPAAPAHDLSGLQCRLLVNDDEWAQDWSAYLQAAGAQVVRQTDVTAAHDASTVWVLQAEGSQQPWPAGACVLLSAGERRVPREEAPQRIAVDVPGLRRDALITAVALAAGRALPATTADSGTKAAASVVLPPGLKILVAEDNATNRKVLQRQLQLLGLSADFAEDGAAALRLWQAGRRRYALLLTDLHMPQLDGYALCAAIRSQEEPTLRLPIVALTANTLQGEAEHCLAAGMDGYLGKPAQIDNLRATLLRWINAAHTAGPTSAAPLAAAAVPWPAGDFDAQALQRLVGDNAVVIANLRREYQAGAAGEHAAIQAAMAGRDWRAAGALAHRWKSSSRAVGALALGQVLEDVERACALGHGDGAAGLAAALDERSTQLHHWLCSLSCDDRPAARPHVLLVDDDPYARALMLPLLQSNRALEVEGFDSAQALLERMPTLDSSSCLALIDLNMPDMDGIELIRHLAEGRYLGALALVSSADRRLLDTAMRLAQTHGLRVLGYLHKPVAAAELRLLLERWQAAPASHAGPGAPVRSAQEVRRAIEAGEVRLEFQPQIEVRSGALAGVEALVRWLHPRDGLLPPSCFVPVAEEHGLIDALTRQVLDLALQQARAWREQNGLAVKMAVNVSMDNLVRLDFPDYVVARLAHHGIAPQDLVLEVTETRLMKDLRAPLDILSRLRLRGIGLSIDDFGTGHSSLAQLRDLPFDELKVDQGFVHGGSSDPRLRAILTGSVEMAQQLGMRVVAEGVEDAADWALVQQSGCTVAQGYLLARPMSGDALPGWLAAWPARCSELMSQSLT